MSDITMGLQLRSTVKTEGLLELSLVDVSTPHPEPDEVVVRVDATPINPSDLGLLFGGADMSTMEQSGSRERPIVTARVPPAALRNARARLDQPLPVGNEAAGVVVQAGASDQARDLMGKTVAILGGAMYGQFRTIRADQCLALPIGTTAAMGASCFVNPLTVLGMVETMRAEGHSGLVHTAAASNLGQMLVRLCVQDGIPLVCIVRRTEQVEMLRALGAKHVLSTEVPSFADELTDALGVTGATLAFDAIGGGKLPSQILSCMEAAANRAASGYSGYGSSKHKQLYIYGGLDLRPTELVRSYGMAWGIGGWLLTAFLQKSGPEVVRRLRERVATEITTTFASHYDKSISLADALRLDEIAVYSRRATGGKYLITPNEGLAR